VYFHTCLCDSTLGDTSFRQPLDKCTRTWVEIFTSLTNEFLVEPPVNVDDMESEDSASQAAQAHCLPWLLGARIVGRPLMSMAVAAKDVRLVQRLFPIMNMAFEGKGWCSFLVERLSPKPKIAPVPKVEESCPLLPETAQVKSNSSGETTNDDLPRHSAPLFDETVGSDHLIKAADLDLATDNCVASLITLLKEHEAPTRENEARSVSTINRMWSPQNPNRTQARVTSPHSFVTFGIKLSMT